MVPQAAYQGHVGAQLSMDMINGSGEGVIQTYEEAERWYRKAADQGRADSQFNICYGYIC